MKGFRNPYPFYKDRDMEFKVRSNIGHKAFEAGKDECLRCLKEKGATKFWINGQEIEFKKGYLAFIEEG